MKNETAINKIITENFIRMKFLSLILLIYSVFTLIIDFGPYEVWNQEKIEIYKAMDVVFALFILLFIAITWFYKQDNYLFKSIIVKVALFFVLIWSTIICSIELNSFGFSTLILIMLVIVFFITTNLLTSIFYFSVSIIILTSIIYYQNKLDQSYISYFFILLMISFISVLISYKNYRNKINEITNYEKVQNLNNELVHIKGNLEKEVEKRTNELYIAKNKAEESDNLKTAFLQNISHEIRTPFNGILGFMELLNEEELTAEQRKKYLNIINKSSGRLMKTINDIVDISMIQTEQYEIKMTDVNINELFSELLNLFKNDAESKDLSINFKNNLPENLEYINTDNSKLNSILSIFIDNAIKFTKKGNIEFGCSYIQTKDKSSVTFYVNDTGIGIPKDKHELIFEKFMQADISNTRGYEGSGLGLSIARAYAKNINGNINIESEVGKGSVFYLTIPYTVIDNEKMIDKKALSSEIESNTSNSDVSGLKILIAEDDETSELFITTIIKNISKEIIKTKSGKEAIGICRNNPDIDLILMDIKMPDMNGYEACRQIRQFNKEVIIIAQTAYAFFSDREKAIEAGCNEYICKPIKKYELLALIQKNFNK